MNHSHHASVYIKWHKNKLELNEVSQVKKVFILFEVIGF